MSLRGVGTEMLAVVSCTDPDNYAASTVLGDEIDMSLYEEVVFILQVGDMAASSTVDYKVRETNSAGGTYADISGKAVTQLTQAGTDSNKQAVIVVRAEELSAGYRYLKDSLTVAVDAVDCGAIAIGIKGRFGPESGGDLSSVDELVN